MTRRLAAAARRPFCAARGVAVHVLLATSGQAGEITDPALDTPANRANLGALREAEARAAGRVLGTTEVHFLRHVDGHLAAGGRRDPGSPGGDGHAPGTA